MDDLLIFSLPKYSLLMSRYIFSELIHLDCALEFPKFHLLNLIFDDEPKCAIMKKCFLFSPRINIHFKEFHSYISLK